MNAPETSDNNSLYDQFKDISQPRSQRLSDFFYSMSQAAATKSSTDTKKCEFVFWGVGKDIWLSQANIGDIISFQTGFEIPTAYINMKCTILTHDQTVKIQIQSLGRMSHINSMARSTIATGTAMKIIEKTAVVEFDSFYMLFKLQHI